MLRTNPTLTAWTLLYVDARALKAFHMTKTAAANKMAPVCPQ